MGGSAFCEARHTAFNIGSTPSRDARRSLRVGGTCLYHDLAYGCNDLDDAQSDMTETSVADMGRIDNRSTAIILTGSVKFPKIS